MAFSDFGEKGCRPAGLMRGSNRSMKHNVAYVSPEWTGPKGLTFVRGTCKICSWRKLSSPFSLGWIHVKFVFSLQLFQCDRFRYAQIVCRKPNNHQTTESMLKQELPVRKHYTPVALLFWIRFIQIGLQNKLKLFPCLLLPLIHWMWHFAMNFTSAIPYLTCAVTVFVA